jgi:hypothetical protein
MHIHNQPTLYNMTTLEHTPMMLIFYFGDEQQIHEMINFFVTRVY